MDFKSKILTYTLITLVILSIGASYYRFIVLKDYIIEAQVDCDPTAESCFIWNCEPGVDCTGNPDDDTWYYMYVHKLASDINDCSTGEICQQISCLQSDTNCVEIYCSQERFAIFEYNGKCTNPSDFKTDVSNIEILKS